MCAAFAMMHSRTNLVIITFKEDVIMALAGSNRGSQAISFSPNSAVKPSGGEAILVSVENDTIMTAKTALSSKDNLRRLYNPGNSSHGLGSNDRIRMLMLSGADRQSMKDARDQKTEEKQWSMAFKAT